MLLAWGQHFDKGWSEKFVTVKKKKVDPVKGNLANFCGTVPPFPSPLPVSRALVPLASQHHHKLEPQQKTQSHLQSRISSLGGTEALKSRSGLPLRSDAPELYCRWGVSSGICLKQKHDSSPILVSYPSQVLNYPINKIHLVFDSWKIFIYD